MHLSPGKPSFEHFVQELAALSLSNPWSKGQVFLVKIQTRTTPPASTPKCVEHGPATVDVVSVRVWQSLRDSNRRRG